MIGAWIIPIVIVIGIIYNSAWLYCCCPLPDVPYSTTLAAVPDPF